MNFKRILIGALFSCAALPVIANADLTISNNTKSNFTAVLVTSNALHPCSGSVPIFPDFTKPGEQNHTVPWNNVKFLCGKASGDCTADVYVTKNCAAGSKVGTATLNLDTLKVTVNSSGGSYNGSTYNVVGSDSHVDVNQN